MRAVAVARPAGEPELLGLPSPEPGPGEVLIRVVAAGLNPLDWKLADRARGGLLDDEVVYPFIYGVDFAGKIAALGDGVTRFAEGDAVFGHPRRSPVGAYGTYAEYVVAAEDGAIAPAPDSLPLPLAAALPTAGQTALSMLEISGLREDAADKALLLVGAAGGDGTFATQLASSRGVKVVAVTRGVGEEQMGRLGAADTVDARTGPPVERLRAAYPDGFDVMIDLASGPDQFAEYAMLVADGGTAISTIGAADARGLTHLGITGINFGVRPNADLLGRLAAEVDAGHAAVQLGAQIPLADAPDALARNRAGKARGKTVILV
ncbi:NADP-dependent oxidoreductase [Yinghuangia sp. ASG 101]|uniref:NADP-dependent oxidoreductase n=1 Tax=Yinghuangia sp. ASG 101 TaxID=2896848 RepID=UPI001E4EC1BF|nr:NADP-dependent oxidoreductase [Yinghuangia sp. ASG 101]UGQ13091.1 NADP-dependent oxidoreductase [Yinghuangia sp. ASG 101]